MGKVSVKRNKNIYQLTREELGLSRAEVIERIPNDPKYPGMPGVPEYKLVKIENGTVAVQPADVLQWLNDITNLNFEITIVATSVKLAKLTHSRLLLMEACMKSL